MSAQLSSPSELSSLVNDLQSAVQVLRDELAAQGMPELSLSSSEPHPMDSWDYLPSPAIYEARRVILGCVGQIKYLVESPLQAVTTSLMLSTESAAIRLVGELGVSDILAAAPDPEVGLTIAELATKTDVDPVKLEMNMRLLVNQGWFRESKTGYFANGRRSRLMSNKLPPSYHSVTSINKIMQKMSSKIPEQINHRSKEFRYSRQPTHSAFNLAFETDLPFLGANGWLASHPYGAHAFHEFMGAISTTSQNAVALDFPWAQVADGTDGIVDVGGGRGTLCCCLAENPMIKQFIVQDLPMLRVNAEEYITTKGLGDRVIFEEHDFFTSQPHKATGDYVYVLQNILHDWSPEDCTKILGHLRDSLTTDSTLIIVTPMVGSGVLSERNTPLKDSLLELRNTAAYKSILPPSFVPEDYGEANRYPQGLNSLLVGLCNAAGRTLPQWTEIFENAGLKIHNIFATRSFMSIMQLGLPPP